MSTTIAPVKDLTYGGTDIQDLRGIYLEIVSGLAEPPSVRGADTVVPGRPGRIRRNRVADTQPIELRGWVCGDGDGEAAQRADFATNRAAFRALFSPTAGDRVLSCTLEDGSTATINASALAATIWNQIVPTYAEVSVRLESVDPDWVITPAGS